MSHATLSLMFRASCTNELDGTTPSVVVLEWTRALGRKVASALALCIEHDLDAIEIRHPAMWYTSLPASDSAQELFDALYEQCVESDSYALLAPELRVAFDQTDDCRDICDSRIKVSADLGWCVEGQSIHDGNDRCSSGWIGWSDDPWAQAHGCPVAYLRGADGVAVIGLPLNPMLLRTLCAIETCTNNNCHSVATLSTSVVPDADTQFVDCIPGRVVPHAPHAFATTSATLKLARQDVTIELAHPGAGPSEVSIPPFEWRQMLRTAADHLSITI